MYKPEGIAAHTTLYCLYFSPERPPPILWTGAVSLHPFIVNTEDPLLNY